MRQRIVTGMLLALLLIVMLCLPGWCMALATLISTGFAVWEEYHALSTAGHRIVSWPAWVCLVISIPVSHVLGAKAMIPLLTLTAVIMIIIVLWRKEPELTDLSMSMMPVLMVQLPGLCLVDMSLVQPKAVEVVLLTMTFAVPLVGDTMALFTGSAIGGRKLCPVVSPKKTVAGAIGGLIGSVIAAMVICAISSSVCNEETLRLLPAWWHYLLLGLTGGFVGQIGDLFASMVKRHSGIKDFSNLFPGHGGMLDRLDSVLFMAVLMFCYRLFAV